MQVRWAAGILMAIAAVFSIALIVASPLWEEVVYKSDTLVVTTKPARETTLILEVIDERGKPVEFAAFLSGPTAGGFVEIGTVRGRGKGGVAIGKYIAETARYARELGWSPGQVSFGILAFIVTSETIDNETYVYTDIITIPINPPKTRQPQQK
ncbi:MAG: hypothetical protein ACK4M3_00230 [Pyrobaculum sp.]